MNEFFIVLFVFALVGAPFILSIIALVQASNAKRRVRDLERVLYQRKDLTPSTPPRVEPRPAAPPAPPPVTAAKTDTPPLKVSPPPPAPPKPPPLPKKDAGLEVALGGKVASFIGIAALVLGVVFFVGYAFQQGWIGPELRIILGLISGGVLIALGHLCEVRSKSLQILARVLTGGGAALLYFSVFAAFGIYHLIGPTLAGGGLALCAAATLGLSLVYRSQIVAILGVLGAFITPWMVGGEFDEGLFPLVFVAAVNVPVLGLGIRRNWQLLYNIAFVFTAIYSVLWLERELPGMWVTGLCFVLLYWIQFVVLGLVKLKAKDEGAARTIDIFRLLANSLLLMGALYWIFDAHHLNDWIGMVYVIAALVHVGLVKLSWKWLPWFKQEILVLLTAAVTFATLALPAQLDGVWVSLGWAIEGMVLAWFAVQFKIPAFQAAGMGLGMLGLGKALVYDPTLTATTPTLFWNSRFVVSLLSTLMLGGQSWLYAKLKITPAKKPSGAGIFEDLLVLIAVAGFIIAVGSDAILALADHHPWTWLYSSFAILAGAVALLMLAPYRNQPGLLWFVGIGLLVLLPIKILLLDIGVCWHVYHRDFPAFLNSVFIICFLLMAGTLWLGRTGLTRSPGKDFASAPIPALLNVVCILSGIVLVTLEISRAATPWKDSAITLWWGGSGLVLVLLGLRSEKRYLRYTALALFGCTIFKVFMIDMADLSGLVRVAAFMGVGVLLLLVSFVYQRAAARLREMNNPETEKPDAS